MKKVIITLLLSLMMTNMFSSTFQTEYNYQMPTFGATSSYIPYNNSQFIEYRGIGYTTNYSNGQFNSTQYYQGVYNPSQNSSRESRPGGQPRRVKGYDGSGNEIGDGESSGPEKGSGIGRGETFWEDEDNYTYYYDKSSKRWYRKDAAGNVSEWDSFLGWHWSILYGHTIPSGSTQGYHENPTPIDDNYIWFMVCIVSIYSLIKWIKLKHLTN